MKKGTLTLNQLQKMFDSLPKEEDMIIKSWKYPFLWLLWFLNGKTIESENWKTYWVEFRGTRYLLKSSRILNKLIQSESQEK